AAAAHRRPSDCPAASALRRLPVRRAGPRPRLREPRGGARTVAGRGARRGDRLPEGVAVRPAPCEGAGLPRARAGHQRAHAQPHGGAAGLLQVGGPQGRGGVLPRAPRGPLHRSMTAAAGDPSVIDPALDCRAVTFENPTGDRGAGGGSYGGRKGSPQRRLAPGEKVVLADLAGPGTVRHIWMTFPPGPPEVMRAMTLEVFYDGAAEPSISVPCLDFFGIPHGRPV